MNQFVQYPIEVTKSTNGGYIVKPAQGSGPALPTYTFANQADFLYWLGLNEQSAP
jgi:hypothetical protein